MRFSLALLALSLSGSDAWTTSSSTSSKLLSGQRQLLKPTSTVKTVSTAPSSGSRASLWMAAAGNEEDEAAGVPKQPFIMPPSNSTLTSSTATTQATTISSSSSSSSTASKDNNPASSEALSSNLEAQLDDLTKEMDSLKTSKDKASVEEDGELHLPQTHVEAAKGFGTTPAKKKKVSSSSKTTKQSDKSPSVDLPASVTQKLSKEESQKVKTQIQNALQDLKDTHSSRQQEDLKAEEVMPPSLEQKLSLEESQKVKAQIQNALNQIKATAKNTEQGQPKQQTSSKPADTDQGPVEIARAQAKQMQDQGPPKVKKEGLESIETAQEKAEAKKSEQQTPFTTTTASNTVPITAPEKKKEYVNKSEPPKTKAATASLTSDTPNLKEEVPAFAVTPITTPTDKSEAKESPVKPYTFSETNAETPKVATKKPSKVKQSSLPSIDIQLPKLEKKDYDKALTVASSTAKVASEGAMTMFKAVAFVAKESAAFVATASEKLNSTTIDDTDMTYREALSKVSKSTHGLAKLLGALAQESATYVTKEWGGAEGGKPLSLPDIASNVETVFENAISSASSAWDSLPKTMKKIQGGATFPGISSGAKKETKAASSTTTTKDKDSKKNNSVNDIPYFLEFANDASKKSKLFSTTVSFGTQKDMTDPVMEEKSEPSSA